MREDEKEGGRESGGSMREGERERKGGREGGRGTPWLRIINMEKIHKACTQM